jgi:hypothetical protein
VGEEPPHPLVASGRAKVITHKANECEDRKTKGGSVAFTNLFPSPWLEAIRKRNAVIRKGLTYVFAKHERTPYFRANGPLCHPLCKNYTHFNVAAARSSGEQPTNGATFFARR